MITGRINQSQLASIRNLLDEVGDVTDLADDFFQGAVQELEEDIKRRARPHRRTGAMQRAIGSRKELEGYSVGFYNTHNGPLALEFGTRFQEAQPILAPAFDENVDRIVQEFEEELERRLPQ